MIKWDKFLFKVFVFEVWCDFFCCWVNDEDGLICEKGEFVFVMINCVYMKFVVVDWKFFVMWFVSVCEDYVFVIVFFDLFICCMVKLWFFWDGFYGKGCLFLVLVFVK